MELVRCLPALLLVVSVGNVKGECNLSLQDDFKEEGKPVFIQDGMFLAPNYTGAISFQRLQTLYLNCPGTGNFPLFGDIAMIKGYLKVQCVADKTFTEYPPYMWEGPFKDIRCDSEPKFNSEEIHSGCGVGRKLYSVGYTTGDYGRFTFYTLYQACFDPVLVRMVYVRHEILPTSIYFYKDHNTPIFTDGGLFGKVNMSELYSVSNQKNRINDLLGSGVADKYIYEDEFLSQGQLAPRSDFSFRVQQLATYHFLNAAPQWQSRINGDWSALEDSLRRRVHSLNRTVTVYTGTHGVLSFDNGKEFYLGTGDDNNGIVPVPLYLYKLVYDPEAKTAVVFVSINSSFYNSTILDPLTICEDVCQRTEYSWMRWKDDTSFCCSYEDAKKLELPELSVNGLFY